jgi:Na+/H+ antiporter NhaD/arsenite permease-like protein
MNTPITANFTEQPDTIITTIVFILTYIALAVGRVPGLRIDRTGIALVGAAAMLVIGAIGFKQAMNQTDWSTVIVLLSLMIIVAQLTESGLISKVANLIIPHDLSPKMTLGLIMAASAATSALITNDVAVLAFIPIIVMRLHERRLRATPFILGCTFAANIGSAATIIGNPQNMIIAEALDIHFLEHLAWAIVPVVIVLFMTWVIILLLGGSLEADPEKNNHEKPAVVDVANRSLSAPTRLRPIGASLGVIALVAVIVLFIMPFSRPVSALCIAGILMLNRVYSTETILGRVDWSLLVLIVSLGVVVTSFANTELPKQSVMSLESSGIDLQVGWQMAIATMVLSNLVNNIPAVMLLLKIIPSNTQDLGLILAVASTFAGNFIIIGSLANMIMVRQAQEHGVMISFWRHARLGIPITILSTLILVGWILIVG